MHYECHCLLSPQDGTISLQKNKLKAPTDSGLENAALNLHVIKIHYFIFDVLICHTLKAFPWINTYLKPVRWAKQVTDHCCNVLWLNWPAKQRLLSEVIYRNTERSSREKQGMCSNMLWERAAAACADSRNFSNGGDVSCCSIPTYATPWPWCCCKVQHGSLIVTSRSSKKINRGNVAQKSTKCRIRLLRHKPLVKPWTRQWKYLKTKTVFGCGLGNLFLNAMKALWRTMHRQENDDTGRTFPRCKEVQHKRAAKAARFFAFRWAFAIHPKPAVRR